MSKITADQFEELKQDVTDARSAADKAKGALETIKETLKNEFKVTTLNEAKKLLTKLEKQATSAEKAFSKAYAEYTENWKDED